MLSPGFCFCVGRRASLGYRYGTLTHTDATASADPLLLTVECGGNAQKPYYQRPFGPGCCRFWFLGPCAGLWAAFGLVDFDSRGRCASGLSRLTDVLDGRSGRNGPSTKESRLPRWLL